MDDVGVPPVYGIPQYVQWYQLDPAMSTARHCKLREPWGRRHQATPEAGRLERLRLELRAEVNVLIDLGKKP